MHIQEPTACSVHQLCISRLKRRRETHELNAQKLCEFRTNPAFPRQLNPHSISEPPRLKRRSNTHQINPHKLNPHAHAN